MALDWWEHGLVHLVLAEDVSHLSSGKCSEKEEEADQKMKDNQWTLLVASFYGNKDMKQNQILLSSSCGDIISSRLPDPFWRNRTEIMKQVTTSLLWAYLFVYGFIYTVFLYLRICACARARGYLVVNYCCLKLCLHFVLNVYYLRSSCIIYSFFRFCFSYRKYLKF